MTIVNPQAAVVIFNYEDRLSADSGGRAQQVNEALFVTTSVLYINTSKSKARPSGTFEIGLAPRYNWISSLTPGSWIVILMTRNKTITTDAKTKATEEQVKLIGRVDSVRQIVEVDSESGARNTKYIVTGRDWGAAFDTLLYIDPVHAVNANDQLSYVGHASRILWDNYVHDWFTRDNLPDVSDTIGGIINLWGSPLPKQSTMVKEATKNSILTTSGIQFSLPKSLVSYLDLRTSSGKASTSISELITLYEGILKRQDTGTTNGYSGNLREAFVCMNPNSVYGTNTFWQLLIEHCNPILNELVTDLRWENGKPRLALYRRILPFANRKQFEGSRDPTVSKFISPFKYIRKTEIPLEDVVTINAGTNWADRINFVQVMPSNDIFSRQMKLDSQTRDDASINRDGLRPMVITSKYIPYTQGGEEVAYEELSKWKFLLREWFFNTHLLLNGSIAFIGQDKYIQVGDNIMVNAKVLGHSKNFNTDQRKAGDTYLLAHVESVEHQFRVNANGARSFVTVVRFVRGTIVDKKGDPINRSDIVVDKTASSMPRSDERNQEVFAVSSDMDPRSSRDKDG